MSSMSPKVPIPVPSLGVLHNVSPRLIGAQGLKRSYNWIFRDGVFRTRDGLNPITNVENPHNLVGNGKDDICWPYNANYINSDFTWEEMVSNTATGMTHAAGTPWRNWWEIWGSYDAVSFSTLDFQDNWTPYLGTEPTYLDYFTNYYRRTYIGATNATCKMVTPLIEATNRRYGARLDPIIDLVAMSGQNVRFWLEGWLVELNPDWVSGTDPVYEKYLWNQTDASETVAGVFRWENPEQPLRSFISNFDGAANCIVGVVEWDAFDIGDKFSPAQLMIHEGWTDAAFEWPSDGAGVDGYFEIGQRPVGFAQFTKSVDNTETVCAVVDTGGQATAGWYKLTADFTWEFLTGSDATDANPNTQTVFRVFEHDTGSSGQRYLIGVNYVDPSLAWDGSGNVVEVEEPTTHDTINARCVAVSYNRVLYGNITDPAFADSSGADAVLWTDALKYNSWTGPDAGYTRLADTPGQIMAMMEIGNQQVVIYKEDSIYIAQATGQSPPFRFDMKQANVVGPCSPLSVVALEDSLHAYLATNGDVVIFDGVRTRSAGLHIQSYIKENMNFGRLYQTFGFFDGIRKELYFFFPAANSQNGFNCVMINTTQASEGSFSLWPLRWQRDVTVAGFTEIDLSMKIQDLSGTIDQLRGVIDGWVDLLPKMVIMTDTGIASELSGNADWDGPIEALLETGTYDLGEMSRWKTVKYIDHLFKAGSGQTIDVWLIKSSYGREEENTTKISVDLDKAGPKKSGHRVTARLISLAMAGSFDQYMEWYGSEAAIELRGNR